MVFKIFKYYLSKEERGWKEALHIVLRTMMRNETKGNLFPSEEKWNFFIWVLITGLNFVSVSTRGIRKLLFEQELGSWPPRSPSLSQSDLDFWINKTLVLSTEAFLFLFALEKDKNKFSHLISRSSRDWRPRNRNKSDLLISSNSPYF